MSIGHLLDHFARVWRPVESLGSHRQTVREYVLLEPRRQVGLTRRRSAVSPARPSGGVTLIGNRKVYMDLPADLQKRDVVEVFEGPDAPVSVEVESATRPRGHHLEATASEFDGKLPDPPAES